MKRWEPRVVVTSVRIGRERQGGENVLAIRIRYDVVSMNTTGNSVILSGTEQIIFV